MSGHGADVGCRCQICRAKAQPGSKLARRHHVWVHCKKCRKLLAWLRDEPAPQCDCIEKKTRAMTKAENAARLEVWYAEQKARMQRRRP